jgi:ABC-type sugar transport system ATPase subunit
VYAYDTAAGSEEEVHLLRAERAYCVLRRAGSKIHVSDTDTEVLVRAEGLFKVFGRRTHDAVEKLRKGTPRDQIDGVTAAVIDASFEVHRGEIFVVMGLS